MKLFRLSSPLLAAFLAALVFSACEKEKIDNSDKDFPMELTVTKTGRNVSLSWTKTNLSDFGGYFLVSSTEPIPNSPEPLGAFEVIDDLEVNSFEHTNFPLAEKIYYKVYAKRGDRFFFSPTVSIDLELGLLDLQFNNSVHSAAQKAIFFLDINQGKIFRFDYGSGEITHSINTIPGWNYKMAVGDAGAGEELYIAREGDTFVEIFDASNLEAKTSMFPNGGSVLSIEVGEGVIYIANSSFSNPLQVISRSNFQLVETGQLNTSFDRRLKRLPSNDRNLIDAGFDRVVIYSFDAQNNLTSQISQDNFTNLLPEVETSPDGKLFIYNLEGQVFDDNLVLQGNVPNQNFLFSHYLFPQGGDKILAFSSQQQIVEFSFPGLQEQGTTDLNYFPQNAFLASDGSVVVVGLVQVGFLIKTIVDVFQF